MHVLCIYNGIFVYFVKLCNLPLKLCSGQIRHVTSAIVTHKTVFVSASRAHGFATLSAHAVIVVVNFAVATVTLHISTSTTSVSNLNVA